MKKTLLALSVALALTAQAHDNHKHDDHDDKIEHIGAHEHGVAQLNVVLDDDELKIELDSPAMNVIGFEHKPETEAHLNQSHDALHKLEDGDWLVINGGGCELDDKDVDWEFAEMVHAHFHADENGEHKHDYKKDDHEHEHEHKHDRDDDHHHDDGETHSDIESEHEFDCKKPNEVKTISVNLFDDFKGFEQLNVQWIVNDKQGATTLTKDNRDLKLQ